MTTQNWGLTVFSTVFMFLSLVVWDRDIIPMGTSLLIPQAQADETAAAEKQKQENADASAEAIKIQMAGTIEREEELSLQEAEKLYEDCGIKRYKKIIAKECATLGRIISQLEQKESEGKATAEANKDREEKCDEAHKNYQEAAKEAKEEQQKHMDTFNDLQEKITAEEAEIKQAEVETAEDLKKLTRKSKQSVSEMRDQLDGELKKMDGQISELQNSLSQMESNIDGIHIKREKLFLKQQEMENKLFEYCYSWAEERLVESKTKITTRHRHKSMASLVTASRDQINQQYQRRFDSYFNHCMRSKKHQKTQQLQARALQIELTELENMENTVKENIEKLKSQIARLQNPDKVRLMSRFKRDMQSQIQNFQADYDAYAKSFAATHEKHIKAIGDLKRKQATALHNRSQAVPQNTKDALYAQKCVQAEQAFNLFSGQGGQMGLNPTTQELYQMMLQNQSRKSASQ